MHQEKKEENMFKLFMTLVLVGSLTYFTGCATRSTLSQNPNVEMLTYEVFGMDCPGCHGGLEKNLSKIPGVVDVTANWKEQMVIIHVQKDHTIDISEIEAAVHNSNFTLGKRFD